MRLVHVAVSLALWYLFVSSPRAPVTTGTATAATALDLVPELKSVARRVVAAAPPNQENNARAVASRIEKFARRYYRAAGKEAMSACEETRVLGDLAHARAEAIDALRELYFASRRETHRRRLDACEAELAHHTESAIRVVRRLLGNPNAYVPGRGFPEGV